MKMTIAEHKMTEEQFKSLDADEVAIISCVTAEIARKLLPRVEGIPNRRIYLVIAADGEILAMTDKADRALRLASKQRPYLGTIH